MPGKKFFEKFTKIQKNLDKKMIFNNMSDCSLILLKKIILSIVFMDNYRTIYKEGGTNLFLSIQYIDNDIMIDG